MIVPDIMICIANKRNIPILRSEQKTTNIISQLTNYLEAEFAPATALHGVLVDLYGVGGVITGESGVGKSERDLEWIKRGHRLVGDDRVEISVHNYDTCVGDQRAIIESLIV